MRTSELKLGKYMYTGPCQVRVSSSRTRPRHVTPGCCLTWVQNWTSMHGDQKGELIEC